MTSSARIVRSGHGHNLPESKLNVVRELERHGYVADPYSTEEDGGALFRHAAAPSLIVHHNGRIELPTGQRVSQGFLPLQPPRKRIRWTRTLLFLAMLGAMAFVGLIVTALIVG